MPRLKGVTPVAAAQPQSGPTDSLRKIAPDLASAGRLAVFRKQNSASQKFIDALVAKQTEQAAAAAAAATTAAQPPPPALSAWRLARR